MRGSLSLAPFIQVMVEPHILAMMLQVKLLLGLGQTAGKKLYSVALVIIPQ